MFKLSIFKVALFLVVLGGGLLLPKSHALDGEEKNHILSVSSGVSNPSSIGTFRENPGGLIYNKSPKLLVGLVSGHNRPDLLGNVFQFYTGNGLVGATLGVQSFNNSMDVKGSLSYLNFGMSALLEEMNIALGFDGSYRFKNREATASDNLLKSWAGNIGLLYNPTGSMRIGLTAYDLSEKEKAFSFGIATDINNFSVLAIDAGVNDHGQGLTIKPGIAVLISPFQLTYSYGFKSDPNASSGITSGNTFGIGYELTPALDIQAYYNYVVDYFLGLKFKF